MDWNHAQSGGAAPSGRPIVIVEEDEVSQIVADSPAIDPEVGERLLAFVQQGRSCMLHHHTG